MASRRNFLISALAAGFAPRPSWADVGGPRYLAASMLPDGKFYLSGLDAKGVEVFKLLLPARGHAAAAHPSRPEAVAFARRPGTFALVIDCRNGEALAELSAPTGRHFYGHGTFSLDGSLLYTTENDFEAGQGRIGVWDAASGYKRVAEFSSGGVGPHEIARFANSDMLVVANGGIETHPDSGRAKLNLPLMRPNLSYFSAPGLQLTQYEPDTKQHLNSIRHIALREDKTVAFAMQWQGEIGDAYPILGLFRPRAPVFSLQSAAPEHQKMQGYGASVAFSGDGTQIAISSSRGGLVQVFDALSTTHLTTYSLQDVSGVATADNGFIVTTGTGRVMQLHDGELLWEQRFERSWDNHLVRI